MLNYINFHLFAYFVGVVVVNNAHRTEEDDAVVQAAVMEVLANSVKALQEENEELKSKLEEFENESRN